MYLGINYVITSIRLFCVSFLLLFSVAFSSVELQFIPGQTALFNSQMSIIKEVKIPGSEEGISTFYSHQGVEALLAIDEVHPLAKFPFNLIITLKSLKFSLKNSERQIFYSSDNMGSSLEMAESKILIGRPLKYILKDLDSPLRLAEEHEKTLGDLTFFQPTFLAGLFEEDLKDFLALADHPLKVGSFFSFTRKVDRDLPVEIDKEFIITEIAPQKITAELKSKIDRKKIVFEKLIPPLTEPQKVILVISGEICGKISWNRNNSLFFTSSQKGIFAYSLKAAGVEAQNTLEIEKEIFTEPLV